MIDWQTIIAALIILAAFLFVARRGWSRFRAMNAKGDACETGCGKCETSSATERDKKNLVQIFRSAADKKSAR